MGAFRTGPPVKKGVLELKLTKKHIYISFEKEDFFELHRSKLSLYELSRPKRGAFQWHVPVLS